MATPSDGYAVTVELAEFLYLKVRSRGDALRRGGQASLSRGEYRCASSNPS